MKKLVGALLSAAVVLTGCSSMRYGEVVEKPVPPQEGNATVTFYRDDFNLPDKVSTSVPVLLEKANFEYEPVGFLNAGYKIRKELPPGKYSFFIGSKQPSRLNAELASNKHYYVRLEAPVSKNAFFAESFLTNPRFEMLPMTRDDLQKDVVQRIRSCTLIKMSTAAQEWFDSQQDLKTKLMNSYRVYSQGGAFGLKTIPKLELEDGIDKLL